jgi:DNA-binding NarL/FixJ family response regulator
VKSADGVEKMLSVVIVAADSKQRTVLQRLVDDTTVATKVHTCSSFLVEASAPVILGLQASNPDVFLVDIPVDSPATAMRTIELLHEELPDSAVFAIGNLNRPQAIVNAMRAGAREFIERSTTSDDLLEAFARLLTARR